MLARIIPVAHTVCARVWERFFEGVRQVLFCSLPRARIAVTIPHVSSFSSHFACHRVGPDHNTKTFTFDDILHWTKNHVDWTTHTLKSNPSSPSHHSARPGAGLRPSGSSAMSTSGHSTSAHSTSAISSAGSSKHSSGISYQVADLHLYTCRATDARHGDRGPEAGPQRGTGKRPKGNVGTWYRPLQKDCWCGVAGKGQTKSNSRDLVRGFNGPCRQGVATVSNLQEQHRDSPRN